MAAPDCRQGKEQFSSNPTKMLHRQQQNEVTCSKRITSVTTDDHDALKGLPYHITAASSRLKQSWLGEPPSAVMNFFLPMAEFTGQVIFSEYLSSLDSSPALVGCSTKWHGEVTVWQRFSTL